MLARPRHAALARETATEVAIIGDLEHAKATGELRLFGGRGGEGSEGAASDVNTW